MTRAAFAIPVLCYHGLHLPGTGYRDNDHVAFEEDLRVVASEGCRIVALERIAAALVEPAKSLGEGRAIGISFDDGTMFDYRDYSDHRLGLVKSFHRILEESELVIGRPASSGSAATSFVIASPEARTILDRTCIAGRGEWGDDWWRECAARGVIAIGNHSWDHVHPTLPTVCQREQRKGSFLAIDGREDADAQIRAARAFIEAKLGRPCPLFAYPFGEANAYLAEEYFPRHGAEHGHLAAFGTGGAPVTSATDRWRIPRFVCGEHWKSPEELRALLRECAR